MKFYAFIPARSGSKRIIDKNLQKVGKDSLIAIACKAAISCKSIFKTFIVTDSESYENEAIENGALTLGLRPKDISQDISSDREWLNWSLCQLKKTEDIGIDDSYVIIRTTTPFRNYKTILNAINHYKLNITDRFTCLRSVKPVSEHPGKMWKIISEKNMSRLLPFETNDGTPWCDSQHTNLPKLFIQNACLEIGNINTFLNIDNYPTSGFKTIPFIMSLEESLDINNQIDLEFANFIFSEI